ncbi:hypothetical protein CsSME_00038062 [Camellia sinensis var. sinensis]
MGCKSKVEGMHMFLGQMQGLSVVLLQHNYELKNISELCASLCYLNLRGCTSVTDAGISILVLRCIKLHSLVVCDTSFGQNSILALTSGIPNLNRFPTQQIDDNNAKSLAFKLQVLHMGGCNAWGRGVSNP